MLPIWHVFCKNNEHVCHVGLEQLVKADTFETLYGQQIDKIGWVSQVYVLYFMIHSGEIWSTKWQFNNYDYNIMVLVQMRGKHNIESVQQLHSTVHRIMA